MSSLEEMKIQLDGIAHVLSDNNLSVPRYQRSYAWTDKQISDLLSDTTEAIRKNEKEYFLGSIVITGRQKERLEVVDGQQRLATVTIILSAIRDYFFEKNDNDRAYDITRRYLEDRDIRSQETIPRFHLNEVDHNYFAKRILSKPDCVDRKIPPTRESHKRIEQAAKLVEEHLKNVIQITNKPEEILIDWIEYFRVKAKVICVSVPDHANAFTIFETLNDRGLDLAVSDLLKNYLFSIAQNRIDEAQQKWTGMIGILEAVAKEEVVVTYIRQLWSSKQGLTREKELYDKIKATITSKQQAVDFAEELYSNAKLYSAILNTSNEVLDDYGSTVKEDLETLNVLGMQQMRPLILSILEKLSIGEAQKCFRFLVSLAVRILIVGRSVGSGAIENNYAQRAVEIRRGDIKTARDLAATMRSIAPLDKEFATSFANITVSRSNLARYYLRTIEIQWMGSSIQPSIVPNSNEQMVNLEHILPLNPSAAWGHIDPETAKAYHNRLGNLTLLQKKVNTEVGNSSFNEKAKNYRKSKFNITSSIATYSKWGVEEIDKRQSEMAQLAIKAWPILKF